MFGFGVFVVGLGLLGLDFPGFAVQLQVKLKG